MGRKSEYLKTIGKTENLKSVGKIASGFVPYAGEWEFSEVFGKYRYRIPYTIIVGTLRWTGIVLGLTKDPIAYQAYIYPTTAQVPAIACNEIFKK